MSKGLSALSEMSRSHLVIYSALVINALFTFIFGFMYLPSLFDVFDLMSSGSDFAVVIQTLAGAFLVLVTDAAFFAWRMLGRQDGVTTEQILVANNAKYVSLAGSLAASLAQIVLGQNLVAIPEPVTYGVSIVGVALGGGLAIAHVWWWDDYQSKSTAVSELKDAAEINAELGDAQRLRDRQKRELELKRQRQLYDIEMRKLEQEADREIKAAQQEAAIAARIAEETAQHERALLDRTSEELKQSINKQAARVARHKADQMASNILAKMGVSPTESLNGQHDERPT